jgi:hypothetical protein
LICSIVVVIRPFSEFGGSSAFLALTVKELVLSVQENLAQQLEATALHLTGSLAGIGLSAFAKYISLPPKETVIARTIPTLFLLAISFFGISRIFDFLP